MDVSKIEDKIDRAAAGGTEISMSLGGIQFRTMIEVMEFAKLMAVSQQAVPHHLRGNPGACLAICTKALRFGFDPFALAEHSMSMKKSVKTETGWEMVETIAYDSFVIRAIINAHAPIKGGIRYSFEGEGDDLVCIALAYPKDGGVPIVHKSATLRERLDAIEKNDKGQLKGSPLWSNPAKVRVQFAYDTGRDLCRVHFPDVLLGWYDRDEMDGEVARAAAAKDVTPKPSLAARLGGNQGAGFSAKHVEKEIKGSAESASAADGKVGSLETEKSDSSDAGLPAETLSVPDAMEAGRAMKAEGKPLDIPANLDAAAADAMRAGYEDAA